VPLGILTKNLAILMASSSIGFVISDLKHQIDLFEASREDAKVYEKEEEEE